ncbi:O-antigen ligase family protein [Streptomyces sp. NPDC050658]|uniref:O-antigen ligase family protein n=1 Tax=unclassified Streptomyces TaxID=2593676 RepID=UPI003418F759
MAATTGPAETYERRGASDATGVALLGVCAAWTLITAGVRGGQPEGVLLAVLAVAAGYAGGRICGTLLPVAAPLAGALAGIALAAAAPQLSPGPVSTAPLGHTGATAALLILASGAACCAAWAAPRPALRLALRLLAAGVVVAAAALGSMAGVAACTGILLCSLASAILLRRRALGLAGLALATALVTGLTWAIADDVLPDGLAASLEGQLDGHRIRLWQDALDLAGREPALGVGPGRFGDVSPTVAENLLPDGKPHSAPLQQAAEQGYAGLALLAAVFCWLLYALYRSPRSTQVVLSAGAALTALAAVASVGNALSVTAVTTGAGYLAGIATARPLGEEAERADQDARLRPPGSPPSAAGRG